MSDNHDPPSEQPPSMQDIAAPSALGPDCDIAFNDSAVGAIWDDFNYQSPYEDDYSQVNPYEN